ncbi:MAG: glycosyltransferase family 2 protein [Nanoarchaeota archaeon]
MKLAVIIPCLNEERTIAEMIPRIPRPEGIRSVSICVIDDGSTDNTAVRARQAGAHVIRHHINKGVGAAFKTGIDWALEQKADIIVNMDGDGQFQPETIPDLIKPIMDHRAEFVTCTRFRNGRPKGMPLIKRVGNRIFTNLINYLTGKRFTDTQCGFRAYTRETVLRMTTFGKFTYTQEVFLDLAHKGTRMTEVALPVRGQRQHGKSKVVKGVVPYSVQAIKIIMRTFRDYRPLTFFGMPGALIMVMGLGVGLGSFAFWALYGMTSPVRTYITISVFFMLLGLLLITLAVLADMLDRIRMNQEEILYRLRK